MNIIKRNYNARLSLVFIATSILSGCSSMSMLWSDNEGKGGKNSPLNNRNQQIDTGFVSQLRQNNANESQATLDDFVKEWESVRPALMRVVALEEDMQFMLQSMSDVHATGPVFASSNTNLEVLDSQLPQFEDAEPLDYVGSKTTTRSKFSGTSNQNPNFTEPNRGSSPVQTLAAPPLMTNNLKTSPVESNRFLTSSDNQAMDDKFSNKPTSQIAPSQLRNSVPNKPASNTLNKFSSSDNCLLASSQDIGVGNAIHLVSYKSKQLLASGSDKLTKQFPTVLCGKLPIFKEVFVNGNTFYSMRFGPFNNRSEALKACSDIKKTGQYCGVTKFDGDQIL